MFAQAEVSEWLLENVKHLGQWKFSFLFFFFLPFFFPLPLERLEVKEWQGRDVLESATWSGIRTSEESRSSALNRAWASACAEV